MIVCCHCLAEINNSVSIRGVKIFRCNCYASVIKGNILRMWVISDYSVTIDLETNRFSIIKNSTTNARPNDELLVCDVVPNWNFSDREEILKNIEELLIFT